MKQPHIIGAVCTVVFTFFTLPVYAAPPEGTPSTGISNQLSEIQQQLIDLQTQVANISVDGGGASSAANGTDMWIGVMGQRGYFIPHINNCELATEAFVQILPNGNGYCIERDQRLADEWEIARHSCLLDNKRLPEVAEFQFACDSAMSLGINDMVGDREWGSNFPVFPGDVRVPTLGRLYCNWGEVQFVASLGGSQTAKSYPYRCVR